MYMFFYILNMCISFMHANTLFYAYNTFIVKVDPLHIFRLIAVI